MTFAFRRKAFVLLVLLYIPSIIGLGYLSGSLLGNYDAAYGLALLWIVAIMFAGGLWVVSRCQSCNSHLAGRAILTGRCGKCGHRNAS
jgi:hypothetical protein